MRSARGDDAPFDAPPPDDYGLPRFGTDPQRPIGARGPWPGRRRSADGAGMRLAPRLSRGEATPRDESRERVSRPSSAPGARLPPLMRGTRGTGADSGEGLGGAKFEESVNCATNRKNRVIDAQEV